MRYARRRDANDQTITDALRAAGFTVDDFSMAVNCMEWIGRRIAMVDAIGDK